MKIYNTEMTVTIRTLKPLRRAESLKLEADRKWSRTTFVEYHL